MGSHRTIALSAVFLLPAFLSLQAQPQKAPFTRLSLEHGLSQSSVYDIVQDHQGFLWFGTQDGLNRYDGYSFVVFRHDPRDSASLPHNYVLRLFVDSKGNLWVGTSGGGVSCYDPATDKFRRYAHDPDDPESLSNNTVYRIYEDRGSVIWVATANGLNRLDAASGTFQRFLHDPSDPSTVSGNLVSAMFEDRRGRFWVATNNGVATLDRSFGRFTRVGPARMQVNTIIEESDGSLWFIGSTIYRYDASLHSLLEWERKLLEASIPIFGSESAVSNGDGSMWVGSYSGLNYLDVSRKRIKRFTHNPSDSESLSENSVLSLCRDRSGILWVGTFNGVNKFVPTERKFELFTHNPKSETSLSNLRVRGFAEDRTGTIWVATQDGLNRFDRTSNRFTRYFGPPRGSTGLNSSHFWCVIVDKTHHGISVWAGANGPGINRLTFGEDRTWSKPMVSIFNPDNPLSRELPNGVIVSLFQDKSGTIWAGHLDGGISTYDPLTEKFFHFKSLAAKTVNVIYEDNSGTIWAGGYACGLHFLDRSKGVFETFFRNTSLEKSIAGNSVLSMQEDLSGSLWVGTYQGLVEIRNGEVASHITDNDGLPNNVIYGILRDDRGNLWLSSNKGLTRFTPATRGLRNFDFRNGLQSNEFNQGAAFRARNGEMYFGGILGFNVFHPDSIKDNPHVPSVVLTDIKVLNRSISPTVDKNRVTRNIPLAEEIRLDYSDNVVTFGFAALEFTNPEENLYAYRLEGFDEDWVLAGTKREATYTNLDPGTYTFRVKASNNDGVWNEQGTAVGIFIAPPWWMSWWFRTILIVLFLSTGPIIYVRRVAALKKQYAIQQEFSRKLIEAQELERKRIATELHDSIGQDLLVIKNRTYMANQVKRLPAKAKTQMNHIMETVTQSLHSVRQVSRNLRPYHLDRVGLTGALRAMLETVAESSHITFDVRIDTVDGLLKGEKEIEVNFYRIIQESVNNVLKHSQATSASIHVTTSERSIHLLMTDNGKGFDVSSVHANGSKAGLGLSGIAERVRILGGVYSIESRLGKGTRISITIPFGDKKGEK